MCLSKSLLCCELFPFNHVGVPEKPEINGLKKPAVEGDYITLTCITQGSKPAADLRWFRDEKEVKGESHPGLHSHGSQLWLHRDWKKYCKMSIYQISHREFL